MQISRRASGIVFATLAAFLIMLTQVGDADAVDGQAAVVMFSGVVG